VLFKFEVLVQIACFEMAAAVLQGYCSNARSFFSVLAEPGGVDNARMQSTVTV